MKTRTTTCLAIAVATFLLSGPGRAFTDEENKDYELTTSCAALASFYEGRNEMGSTAWHSWNHIYGHLYDQARETGRPVKSIDAEISKKRKKLEVGMVRLRDQDPLCHDLFDRYRNH